MRHIIAPQDVPKEPAIRRAWVIYQLRLRGLSLRRLAKREGVSHNALGHALVAPSSHIEPVLAKALGLKVRELFPERFDEHGHRLHLTRPPQRNTRPSGRNVYVGDAA